MGCSKKELDQTLVELQNTITLTKEEIVAVAGSLNHLSLNDLTTSGIKILAQRK
jgi:hypothetical protein